MLHITSIHPINTKHILIRYCTFLPSILGRIQKPATNFNLYQMLYTCTYCTTCLGSKYILHIQYVLRISAIRTRVHCGTNYVLYSVEVSEAMYGNQPIFM